MIEKAYLENRYLARRKSMQEIANELNCSLHKVAYYMDKHSVARRSRSEAIYKKHTPERRPIRSQAS